MFHELLMALNGTLGAIFYVTKEKDVQLSPCIPNLHPAERSILEKLTSIISKYKKLLDFVKKYKYNAASSDKLKEGLYLKAFCSGLETIFNTYQQELVQIEDELLRDVFLPLTHFLKLEKYDPLFSVLCEIASQIEEQQSEKIEKKTSETETGSQPEPVHGCRILELLYNHSLTGIPIVEVEVNKVLQSCHQVMYRQVFCWMINGYIEDPFHEFFIQLDENSVNLKFASLCPNNMADKLSLKYVVEPRLLPSHIPSSVADKILVAGRDVSVLGAAENSDSYKLFLKKEKTFSKKFEKLIEKPCFSLLNFETTIDEIKKWASEHLWNVIVKKLNVKNHFKVLRDFYFLGKGELFINFIEEANQLLRMPVTLSTETDASKLFHTIARKTYPDDESITEKFHIGFQEKKKDCNKIDKESLSKTKLESGWSAITLYYDVPHQLHILITPEVIDQYNMIFRFLLSVRKVQMELHQCWALQMQNKKNCQDPVLIPFWTLRSHMSFLIDNFQYYVFVDVLETSFKDLDNKMESVMDFEELQLCHNKYLSSIISLCFLKLQAVHQSLNEIMEICSSFCTLMNRINVTRNQKDLAQFESIRLNFQRHSALLFRILNGVHNHQATPHLAQLLLRIDYNNYLATLNRQLIGKTQK